MEVINFIVLGILIVEQFVIAKKIHYIKNEIDDVVSNQQNTKMQISEIDSLSRGMIWDVEKNKKSIIDEVDDLRNLFDTIEKSQKALSTSNKKIMEGQEIITENQQTLNLELIRIEDKLDSEFSVIDRQYCYLRNKMNPILDSNSVAYADLQKKYDILSAQKSHIHLQKQLEVVSAERNQLREELNKRKEIKDKILTEQFIQAEKQKEKEKEKSEVKKKGRPVGQKNSPDHKAGRPKKTNSKTIKK